MGQELQTFAIEKFLGRITNYADVAVDPGYAKLAKDIDWRSSKGALQGSKAHTKITTIASTVLSLFPYSGKLFCTTSTKAYYNGVEAKFPDDTAYSGDVVYCQVYGKLIGVNGSKIIKYNGSYLDELGTSQPTNGSFAAAGTGSGSFTVGNWQYVVTYVNRDDFEGIAGTAITATNQGASKTHVALTNIPTGPANEGIKARKIYRTTDGGATFYLLHTISDNTTTTYDDSNLDASLGTTSPSVLNVKPISSVTLIERVGSRIFIAGSSSYPRRLWYSLPIPYHEGFPSTYYEDFPDTIVSLCRMGDSLLVQTTHGGYIFYNLDDVTKMTYKDLPRAIPANSKRAMKAYDNEDYWAGPYGIYRTSGITVEEDSYNVQDLFSAATVEVTDMEFDSAGVMYLISAPSTFSSGGASAELGRIIDLTIDDSTATFSAETGRIVRMTSADTVFIASSEYGRIVAISIGETEDAGEVIVRTPWGGDTLWSVDTQKVYSIANDPTTKTLYVGGTDGIYRAFDGDRRAWQWQSVYSNLGDGIRRKNLACVRFRVVGDVTISIYGDDDVLLHTEAISEASTVVKEVVVPHASWSYTFSVKLEGSATSLVEPPLIYFFTTETI